MGKKLNKEALNLLDTTAKIRWSLLISGFLLRGPGVLAGLPWCLCLFGSCIGERWYPQSTLPSEPSLLEWRCALPRTEDVSDEALGVV